MFNRQPPLLQKATLTRVVNKIKISSHLGEEFLPFKPVPTEKTIWDVVEADMGMAKFVAPDAESPLVDKRKIDQVIATIASIREKERFIESDLRAIREAGELPIVEDSPTLMNALKTQAEQRLRDSLTRLKNRVANRLEWMRWQAMLGTVSYDDGDVIFSVDYGIPAANKVTLSGTAVWSDTTNADPLKNINDWIDTYIDNQSGLAPTRMVMSRKSLGYIAQNAKIRDLLKYNNNINPEVFGSPKMAQQLILNLTDIVKIHVYDSFYEDASGTSLRYLAQNKIIMLPEPVTNGETLGDVADGPHPHNNYKPGLYTWTETKKDPYTTFVGVGRECFPRIFHPDWIFVATVY